MAVQQDNIDGKGPGLGPRIVQPEEGIARKRNDLLYRYSLTVIECKLCVDPGRCNPAAQGLGPLDAIGLIIG